MVELINKINELLKGKKTYIGALLIAIVAFANAAGYIDNKTFETARTALIAWIAMSVRAAIK